MRYLCNLSLCAFAHFREVWDRSLEDSHHPNHEIFAGDYLPPSGVEDNELFAGDYLRELSPESKDTKASSSSLLTRMSSAVYRTLGFEHAAQNEMRYFVLSMNASDFRRNIFSKNQEKIPNTKLFRAINGYDPYDTVLQYNRSRLYYHGMKPGYESYGMLANFLTKYAFMKFQVFHSIPYACWIEDDLEFEDTFAEFVTNVSAFLTPGSPFNMVRLDHWGEGYITTLEGAQRVLALIEEKGIIDNPDDQLREYCGPEIAVSGTPWKLMQPTNTGDILQTPSISRGRRSREKWGFPPPSDGWQWHPPEFIHTPQGAAQKKKMSAQVKTPTERSGNGVSSQHDHKFNISDEGNVRDERAKKDATPSSVSSPTEREGSAPATTPAANEGQEVSNPISKTSDVANDRDERSEKEATPSPVK